MGQQAAGRPAQHARPPDPELLCALASIALTLQADLHAIEQQPGRRATGHPMGLSQAAAQLALPRS